MKIFTDLLSSSSFFCSAAGPIGKGEQLRACFDELVSKFVESQSEPPLQSLQDSFAPVFPQAVAGATAAAPKLCDVYCAKWAIGGLRQDKQNKTFLADPSVLCRWRKDMNKKDRKGGLHFCTMRAMARRGGRYNSRKSVSVLCFHCSSLVLLFARKQLPPELSICPRSWPSLCLL